MKELTKEELYKINGGGLSIGMGIGLIAGISFLIGVVDGIIRPLRCN